MRNNRVLTLLLMTVTLSLAFAFTPSVQASPGPRLSLDTTGVVPAGSLTTTDVEVSFMVPFDAFDVSVRANSAAISPQSISMGSLLTSPIIVANCINGSGTGCSISDGSGVAHLAAASGTGAQTTVSRGVLFSVTWKAGSAAGSPIVISCQLIARAGSQISGVLVVNTDYGTVSSSAEPSFIVPSAATPLSVHAGSSRTIPVNVTALNGFANDVSLSVVTSSPSVTATLTPTTVVCDCVNKAISQLTTSTTAAGTFTVTVTGSFVFHGTRLSSSGTITVNA